MADKGEDHESLKKDWCPPFVLWSQWKVTLHTIILDLILVSISNLSEDSTCCRIWVMNYAVSFVSSRNKMNKLDIMVQLMSNLIPQDSVISLF